MILSGLIAMFISWQHFHSPLRPGLDFIGGTRLQLELDCTQSQNCDRPIDIAKVRRVLASQGLGEGSIQLVGNEEHAISIRTQPLNVEQRTKLQAALTREVGAFSPNKIQIETVGPILGKQLFISGMTALAASFTGIAIYLSLRFQLDYAVIAIIALLHDVLITVGVFSILGLIFGIEADSLFIVALLTIAGFSVHDTVVIYDRVRENLKLTPERPIDELIDASVRQTLTRSINTVVTVLITLFSLFLLGGATLKNFALTLIIGFTMGAYSSIFIASPLLAWWRGRSSQTKSEFSEQS